jgi:hypothetical protein
MADVKPADVYVGVIELFSVFLPGALLTASIALLAQADLTAFSPLLDADEARWVAFAIVSYALGAFVASGAAEIDSPYDTYRGRRWPDTEGSPYRRATSLRLAYFKAGEKIGEPVDSPLSDPGDMAAKDMHPALKTALYFLVGVAPSEAARPVLGTPERPLDRPMNTFTWAKTVLLLRAPAAFAEVQRYEAESKFFRSLILVLPIAGLAAALHWALIGQFLLAVLALAAPWPLARLSFARYAERRRKSTQWAYSYVISLQLGPPVAEPPKAGGKRGD